MSFPIHTKPTLITSLGHCRSPYLIIRNKFLILNFSTASCYGLKWNIIWDAKLNMIYSPSEKWSSMVAYSVWVRIYHLHGFCDISGDTGYQLFDLLPPKHKYRIIIVLYPFKHVISVYFYNSLQSVFKRTCMWVSLYVCLFPIYSGTTNPSKLTSCRMIPHS